MEFQPSVVIEDICTWISNIISSANAKGAVLGLSGGIDSSVSAYLLTKALGRDKVLGVAMPCHSIPEDYETAKRLADGLGIDFKVVDLTSTYDELLNNCGDLGRLASVNIRPRLRMTTLYALGQERGYLVCGNGNKAEWVTGYFTKFGDSACDFMPLLDLSKGEVRALAIELGVPEDIVTKPPSAGLWKGQTDEGELGISYDDIDRWIQGEPITKEIQQLLEQRFRATEHKRKLPPFYTKAPGRV